MKVKPRDYQRAGLDGVCQALQLHTSILLDMATGTGKTYMFGWLPMVLSGRFLVLCHREELIRQAVAKINRVDDTLGVTIERREDRGEVRRERNLFDLPSRVVVASKDTLRRPKRLRRYRPDDFDYVLIDEAHRAVRKNESYMSILRHFVRPPIGTGHARLIGVSGSLDRADREALAGLFEGVAYRYTLPEGIADGYLVQPRAEKIHIKGITITGLPTTKTPDGQSEVSQVELDRVMRRREYAFGVARPLLDFSQGWRQGVVFASSGPQAQIQVNVLNSECPGCAAFCLGDKYQNTDQRREVLERFAGRDVQFLVTCDVLTEGWDSDLVDIVVPKPTQSRQRMAQMAGRGTRPRDGCVDPWPTAELRKMAIAASPKPDLLVLDPCGVTDQHSLVSISDIYDGKYSGEWTRKRPAQPGRPNTPEDRQAQLDERNAELVLEEARLAGLSVNVEYETTTGNMMDIPRIPAPPVPRSVVEHPATEKQCRWLAARGIIFPADMTKSQARDAISAQIARENHMPATDGQRAALARYNLPVNVTRGEARRLLTARTTEDNEPT